MSRPAPGQKFVGVGTGAGRIPGSFFFRTFPLGFADAATLGASLGGDVAGGSLATGSQPAAKAAAIETMRQRTTIRMGVSWRMGDGPFSGARNEDPTMGRLRIPARQVGAD